MPKKRQPSEKQDPRRTIRQKSQASGGEKANRDVEMGSYRVFVSYSRDDVELVEKIVKVLEENRLIPMWDRNFAWGHGFPDQIKNFIAHTHVFMPIITEASGKRGWVHQEIGYATALNIPILPIAVGRLPGEMLRDLHAVTWTNDKNELKRRLSRETFESLVQSAQHKLRPLFESAEYQEQRTMMMVEYATNVLELNARGKLRQKGALSSMHIPDKQISHPYWQERYGDHPKSEFHCDRQLQERLVLEKHARKMGCSLIIDPYQTYELYGPSARMVRLKPLLEFLNSMPKDKVEIAINRQMQVGHNLTIVGDWFAAESVSAELGKGYKQTIFTRHAPTVRSRIEAFDREMAELLEDQRKAGKSSVQVVTEEIKKILADITVPGKPKGDS